MKVLLLAFLLSFHGYAEQGVATENGGHNEENCLREGGEWSIEWKACAFPDGVVCRQLESKTDVVVMCNKPKRLNKYYEEEV